jgi:hypothetical protein
MLLRLRLRLRLLLDFGRCRKRDLQREVGTFWGCGVAFAFVV